MPRNDGLDSRKGRSRKDNRSKRKRSQKTKLPLSERPQASSSTATSSMKHRRPQRVRSQPRKRRKQDPKGARKPALSPPRQAATKRKHARHRKQQRKRQRVGKASAGSSTPAQEAASQASSATDSSSQLPVLPVLPGPLFEAALQVHAVRAPPDSQGLFEALERASQEAVATRTSPSKPRLNQYARRQQQQAVKRQTKLTALRLLDQQQPGAKSGRPRADEPSGPRPGSRRYVASVAEVHPSTVSRWAEQHAAGKSPAGPATPPGRRGGHNKRIDDKMKAVAYYFAEVRQEKHSQTTREDIARMIYHEEKAVPELRTPAAQRQLDKGELKPPSLSVITRFNAEVGLSWQKAQPIKPQRTSDKRGRNRADDRQHQPLARRAAVVQRSDDGRQVSRPHQHAGAHQQRGSSPEG
jgi:hypothetical protein